MNEAVKKKLEEKAEHYATRDRIHDDILGAEIDAYMAGAQAAWDLAVKAERYRCRGVALEQRCERGTGWDAACVEIANKILSAADSVAYATAPSSDRTEVE